jgi:predicted acylesterase/phospholipase RssA
MSDDSSKKAQQPVFLRFSREGKPQRVRISDAKDKDIAAFACFLDDTLSTPHAKLQVTRMIEERFRRQFPEWRDEQPKVANADRRAGLNAQVMSADRLREELQKLAPLTAEAAGTGRHRSVKDQPTYESLNERIRNIVQTQGASASPTPRDLVLTAAEFGLGTVQASSGSTPVPGNTALALSGGGAKGSFEAGAIMYIAEHWTEIQPGFVAGASAGALNALAVSQWKEASATKLPLLWLSLRNNQSMFVESAQLTEIRGVLDDLGVNLDSALAGGNDQSPDWNKLRLIATFVAPAVLSLVPVLGSIAVDEVEERYDLVIELLGLIKNLDRMYSLQPVQSLLDATFRPTYSSSNALPLRMVFVSMADGKPYYVDQHGKAYRFSALQPRSRNPEEIRTLLGEDTVDAVIRGAIASSSIPVIFGSTTVQLSRASWVQTLGDLFAEFQANNSAVFDVVAWHEAVDGGVRDNLPLHAASLSGMQRVIAISASPRDIDESAKFGSVFGTYGIGLFDALGRTINIITHEVTETDRLEGAIPEVVLITPIFLVHDVMTVDPGLIRLNVEYGYMRAYDALNPIPQDVLNNWLFLFVWTSAVVSGTEELVATRKQIWGLESLHALNSSAGVVWGFTKSTLDQIRNLKRQVYDNIKRRIDAWGSQNCVPLNLPDGGTISEWWLGWERHTGYHYQRLDGRGPWDRQWVIENGEIRFEAISEVPAPPPPTL